MVEPGRVAARTGRVAGHGEHTSCRVVVPSGHDRKFVLQHMPPVRHRVARTPGRIAGRVIARCCRVAALYCSLVELYCDINGCPQPRYNFCIATHPWPGHARARAPLAPALRPTVSRPLLAMSWGCVVGLLAVSWPPAARPSHPVSQYNPLYRDSD